MTRARILDESLDVLEQLWSGEPVSFEGEHLRTQAAPFLPTPVQRPRIPVWVAALWPAKRPMRRAAAWDGVFPIKAGGGFEYQMTPAEMADARAYIEAATHARGALRHRPRRPAERRPGGRCGACASGTPRSA